MENAALDRQPSGYLNTCTVCDAHVEASAYPYIVCYAHCEVLSALARVMKVVRIFQQTLAVHSNTVVVAFDPLEAHSILTGHLPRGPAECQTGELAAVLDRFQGGTCHDSKEPCNTSMASCFGRIGPLEASTGSVALPRIECNTIPVGRVRDAGLKCLNVAKLMRATLAGGATRKWACGLTCGSLPLERIHAGAWRRRP